MTKRILALLCMFLLLGVLAAPVYAVEPLDMTKKGSLTITMTHKGKAVPGGKLTVFRVAEVVNDDWDLSFRYLPGYEDCIIPIERLESPLLADALAAMVKTNKLTGITRIINSSGKVTFSLLEQGVYLVVQTTAAPGYSAVTPFVVTVPGRENGKYVYDVDATPKMDVEPKPTTTPPTTKPSGKLPQTGQLSWPVPVMLSAGLLCIVGGCCLVVAGKKKDHEN